MHDTHSKTEETNTSEKNEDKLTLLFILILVVISIWIIAIFSGKCIKAKYGVDDVFASIDTLFSGLALAGIIFTILLQKKELSLQRKELKDTRQEFIKQNETIRIQRFENTFFQLLSLHHDIVGKLSITGISREHIGRETFIQSVFDLKNFYWGETHYSLQDDNGNFSTTELFRNSKEEEIDCVICAYNKHYLDKYHNVLGHYFRNLYHIFKFIYLTKQIANEQKQFYANIIRAQLSNAELTLLFYNCFVENLGYPKFKFLVENFDILQNMDEIDLIDKSHKILFEELTIDKNPFEEEIKNNAYL